MYRTIGGQWELHVLKKAEDMLYPWRGECYNRVFSYSRLIRRIQQNKNTINSES